ncbi:MAG: DUF2939 domain-containing protein [Deltaproteobacteria bacterium]|nr:DUF2939 domain-containing protein [Deltaproteobacteria bacterium]
MSSRKDAIQRFFKAHRRCLVRLTLVALVAGLAAAAAWLYLYRIGPDYAFANLRAALAEGDKAQLAAMVDFRALSEDLVLAALAVHPQAAANETRKAEMQDEAQRLVLKSLAAGKAAKPEVALPRKLFDPVPFAPEDAVAQFAAGMQLVKSSGETQIRSRFTHNGLQTEFPLHLLLESRQGDWRVTRLLNARELVSLHKGAVEALLAEDEARLAEKNEKIMTRMRAHFHAPQCLASVSLMGGKQEAMLVVKVTASNTDEATLHNVNLVCDVRAGNGTPLYSRQLNVVQRVYGGGAFSNTWTVALDADSEDATRLLQAGPLSCTVEPKVMNVGLGEVLYRRTD